MRTPLNISREEVEPFVDEYIREDDQKIREAIARIERRSKSKKRRIQELDELRSIYRACGCCPTALDLLEQQMVTWGRVEHSENAILVTHCDEEMKRLQVDPTKGEWDEGDRRSLGLSHAYAEARYALRFQSISDAILTLASRRRELMEMQRTCNEYDRQKLLGEAEGLQSLIEQLQQQHFPISTVAVVLSD
jgi:hypothetical protein